MMIVSIKNGIPDSSDWIKLGFHPETWANIIKSLKYWEGSREKIILGVELRINSTPVGDIKLKRIIKRPGGCIWAKPVINFFFNNNQEKESALRDMISDLGLSGEILAINMGSCPDDLIHKIDRDLKSDKYVPDLRDIRGLTQCNFHNYVMRGLRYRYDHIPDWQSGPGYLIKQRDGLKFVPLEKIFEWIWNKFKNPYGIHANGMDIFQDIMQCLELYKKIIVEEKDVLGYINLMKCAGLPDQDEIIPHIPHEDLFNQELITDLLVKWCREHMDFHCSDHQWNKNLFTTIYHWMKSKGHPGFQEIRENKTENDIHYENVIKYLWDFFELYRKESGVPEPVYQELVEDMKKHEKGVAENKLAKTQLMKEKDLIWYRFEKRNAIPIGDKEYNIGINQWNWKYLLLLISNWVFRNWKKKNITGDEFFLINQLRGRDDVLNSIKKNLVVIENSYFNTKRESPHYLIKLKDEENNLYSVIVSGTEKSVKKLAMNNRGKINQYWLAIHARNGDIVKLSAGIRRVYMDDMYFVWCKELKNIRGICINEKNS